MNRKKVLIIIPAYNEEACIKTVVDNIKENYSQYDYVVVNDGSKDKTSKICHEQNYNIIDLPVNLGLAGAFQTGMKYAYYNGYECAIQFDADGQHKAEYIAEMYQMINEGYDIVVGSRFLNEKKPFTSRMIGSRLITSAIKLSTGMKINDPTSGMRMYGHRVLQEFAFNINYGPEPDTVSYMIKRGAKVKEVQVDMNERMAGVSYLNFVNSIKYMMRILLSIIVIQSFRKNQPLENDSERG